MEDKAEKKLDLNEVIGLAKKVTEFWEHGVIHIDMYEPYVQMDEKAFFNLFGRREDIEENFSACLAYYPYSYSIFEQGVKFSCTAAAPVDLRALRELLREQDHSDARPTYKA